MATPTPNAVALARHIPTAVIGRYDEMTCDGVSEDGTATITLLNLMDDEVMVVAPARDVEIITYEEEPDAVA